MSAGTIILFTIVVMITIAYIFGKIKPKKRTSVLLRQPQNKKTTSDLSVVIKCVERDLQIIDESKNIINKSKNIDTIIGRFTTIFTCINRIKEYDSKYRSLGLKPPISDVEQFYKGEKERFITNHVIEQTNEIIINISSEVGNAKKVKIAKDAYIFIDKVKKELIEHENINKLEEIAKKISELSNVPIPEDDTFTNRVEYRDNKSYTRREGKIVPTDDAFKAWTSRDLKKMLDAMKVRTNRIDRHFLLMGIVDETYKKRKDPEMRKKCKEVAEIHLKEFPTIVEPLKKDMGGELPQVSTFQKYATVLAEDGEYDKAIEACKIAISYQLTDGTESGYEGRIERIKKEMKGAEKNKDNIRSVPDSRSSDNTSSVPKRIVKSHRTDQKALSYREIEISSLAYIPLPRSPMRVEEKSTEREKELNVEKKDRFQIHGDGWNLVSIEEIQPSERPDPAFRQIYPSNTGLIMIDDLGKADGLGQIEAAALRYDRSGNLAAKAGLKHGVYRIGVHPCGRGLIALSRDCIAHAYDENLDLLFETNLFEAPEIQALRKRFEIGDDNLKNHIRCVALSQDISRYLFTAVDEAWCINTNGEGIWGAKLPLKEGWTRVSTPSTCFGTSTDVNNALSLMKLSFPITPEAVKQRYRELARQWHPDLNPGDSQAEAKMKALNSAVELVTGLDATTFPNYSKATFFQELSRTEYEAHGIKFTMSAGMNVGEIYASDWIYAAGFSVKTDSVYLAGYSGRVVMVDDKGKGIRVYDIGSVPRRIIDTGDYLYMLTDTRLYVLRDDALHTIVDITEDEDLVVAQTGFGLLEKKRLRWFLEDGTYLGNIVSKEPIRRVYSTSGNTIIETRQHRAIITGIPGWWE